MPYPNYHVAVVRDNNDFIDKSIRTTKLPKSEKKSDAQGKGGVLLREGKLKNGDGSMTAQSYLFPKDLYTVAQAKKWLEVYKAKCTEFHPARESSNSNATLSNITWTDKGDHVVFPAAIAAEGIFSTPDGHNGLRTADEVKAMVPFCNSLRVVINHPGTETEALTAAVLADEDYPVVGWTENARFDASKGVARVLADISVLKVDKAGNDQGKLIQAMQKGQMADLSIGYFYNPVPAVGANYDHLETQVNPYHLAILDGLKPQCAPPICGVGCNHKTESACNSCPCKDNAYVTNKWHEAILRPETDFVTNTMEILPIEGDQSVKQMVGMPKGGNAAAIHKFLFPILWTAEKIDAWLAQANIKPLSIRRADPSRAVDAHSKGGQKLAEEDDNNNPKEKPVSIAKMNLNAIMAENAEVKALADQKAALETRVKALEADAVALNAKAKKGDEAVAVLEKQKAEARAAQLAKLKDGYGEEQFNKLFPEDQVKDLTDQEVGRHMAILDMAAQSEAPDAPEGPAPPGTNSSHELKVPAGKNAHPAANARADDVPLTQKLFRPLAYQPLRRPDNPAPE